MEPPTPPLDSDGWETRSLVWPFSIYRAEWHVRVWTTSKIHGTCMSKGDISIWESLSVMLWGMCGWCDIGPLIVNSDKWQLRKQPVWASVPIHFSIRMDLNKSSRIRQHSKRRELVPSRYRNTLQTLYTSATYCSYINPQTGILLKNQGYIAMHCSKDVSTISNFLWTALQDSWWDTSRNYSSPSHVVSQHFYLLVEDIRQVLQFSSSSMCDSHISFSFSYTLET